MAHIEHDDETESDSDYDEYAPIIGNASKRNSLDPENGDSELVSSLLDHTENNSELMDHRTDQNSLEISFEELDPSALVETAVDVSLKNKKGHNNSASASSIEIVSKNDFVFRKNSNAEIVPNDSNHSTSSNKAVTSPLPKLKIALNKNRNEVHSVTDNKVDGKLAAVPVTLNHTHQNEMPRKRPVPNLINISKVNTRTSGNKLVVNAKGMNSTVIQNQMMPNSRQMPPSNSDGKAVNKFPQLSRTVSITPAASQMTSKLVLPKSPLKGGQGVSISPVSSGNNIVKVDNNTKQSGRPVAPHSSSQFANMFHHRSPYELVNVGLGRGQPNRTTMKPNLNMSISIAPPTKPRPPSQASQLGISYEEEQPEDIDSLIAHLSKVSGLKVTNVQTQKAVNMQRQPTAAQLQKQHQQRIQAQFQKVVHQPPQKQLSLSRCAVPPQKQVIQMQKTLITHRPVVSLEKLRSEKSEIVVSSVRKPTIKAADSTVNSQPKSPVFGGFSNTVTITPVAQLAASERTTKRKLSNDFGEPPATIVKRPKLSDSLEVTSVARRQKFVETNSVSSTTIAPVGTPKPTPGRRGRPRKIRTDQRPTQTPPQPIIGQEDSVEVSVRAALDFILDAVAPELNNRGTPKRHLLPRQAKVKQDELVKSVAGSNRGRGGARTPGSIGRGRGRGRPPNSERVPYDERPGDLSKHESEKPVPVEPPPKTMKTPRKTKEEKKAEKALEQLQKRKIAGLLLPTINLTPCIFEEDTRMSAADNQAVSQIVQATPPAKQQPAIENGDSQSQSSISQSSSVKKTKRLEVIDSERDFRTTVDNLMEYQWPLNDRNADFYMLQEQIAEFLDIKSFKRKYPDLKRRPVEAHEKDFLREKGVVSETQCDLGLTALWSHEVLDIMYTDFPQKYEEYHAHVRHKKEKDLQKSRSAPAATSKSKPKDLASEMAQSASNWNSLFNRTRCAERRYCMDLQSYTIQQPYNKGNRLPPSATSVGHYPIALLAGQYSDHYKRYTSSEMKYMPLNTVLFGPINKKLELDSQSDSDSESSDSDSSSASENEKESTDAPKDSALKQEPTEAEENTDSTVEEKICKICNGNAKKNKMNMPEPLVQCAHCKSCGHGSCFELSSDMISFINNYDWQCTDCKTCYECKDPTDEDKILFCDQCDRGFHIYCVGLRKVPDGRWHCKFCAVCGSCGAKEPNTVETERNTWQHEYKRNEKGIRVHIRCLCVPCSRLWKKNRYCLVCYRCFLKTTDPNLIVNCANCERGYHIDCINMAPDVRSGPNFRSQFICEPCLSKGQIRSISASPVINLAQLLQMRQVQMKSPSTFASSSSATSSTSTFTSS